MLPAAAAPAAGQDVPSAGRPDPEHDGGQDVLPAGRPDHDGGAGDGAAVCEPVPGFSPDATQSRFGDSRAEVRSAEAQPQPCGLPVPCAKTRSGHEREHGEEAGRTAAGSRNGAGEQQESQEVGQPQPKPTACGEAPTCVCAGGLSRNTTNEFTDEFSSAPALLNSITQTQVDPPVLSRSTSPAHGKKGVTASGYGKVFYEAAVKAVLKDEDLQRVGPQDEEICDLLDQTQTENQAQMLGREAFGGLLGAAINLSPAGGQAPHGFQNGSPQGGLLGQVPSPGSIWTSTPEGDGWASTPEKEVKSTGRRVALTSTPGSTPQPTTRLVRQKTQRPVGASPMAGADDVIRKNILDAPPKQESLFVHQTRSLSYAAEAEVPDEGMQLPAPANDTGTLSPTWNHAQLEANTAIQEGSQTPPPIEGDGVIVHQSDSDRDAAMIEKVQEELREKAAGELAPLLGAREDQDREALQPADGAGAMMQEQAESGHGDLHRQPRPTIQVELPQQPLQPAHPPPAENALPGYQPQLMQKRAERRDGEAGRRRHDGGSMPEAAEPRRNAGPPQSPEGVAPRGPAAQEEQPARPPQQRRHMPEGRPPPVMEGGAPAAAAEEQMLPDDQRRGIAPQEQFLVNAIEAAVRASRPEPRAQQARVPRELTWPRVKEKYSGAGAMSIQEYYDRYMELTRYVPEAFRHQHFVSEALVDRVRNAQNLHWKARGREDLHNVTMDELLANIAKEYDKKHQTHEALTAYMGFKMGTLEIKEYIRIRTEKRLKLKTLGIEISNSIEHTMFVASLAPAMASYLFEDPTWERQTIAEIEEKLIAKAKAMEAARGAGGGSRSQPQGRRPQHLNFRGNGNQGKNFNQTTGPARGGGNVRRGTGLKTSCVVAATQRNVGQRPDITTRDMKQYYSSAVWEKRADAMDRPKYPPEADPQNPDHFYLFERDQANGKPYCLHCKINGHHLASCAKMKKRGPASGGRGRGKGKGGPKRFRSGGRAGR